MATKAAMTIFGGLLLAGCAVPYSPAPLATNYPTSKQGKLQAAAHWREITAHIEKELTPPLKKSPNLPLFIEAAQPTAFNQTLTSELITSLVKDGYVVGKSPANALRVEIDTQVVAFSRHRPQYRFAGEATALSAGAWVISGIEPTSMALGAAIASSDAYYWFRSEFATGATPQTEIVVTISISDERRYYSRSTSVYYISDSERNLYEVPPPKVDPYPSKTYTVKGS